MHPRVAGVLLTLLLCFCGRPSSAALRGQVVPSPASPAAAASTASGGVALPPELDGSNRQHVGTAEESVCYVTVEMRDPQTGKTEKRDGSGFVIRCDGFLLVPTALLSSRQTDGEGKLSEVRFAERANEFRFLKPKSGKTPPAQQVGILHFFRDSRGFVAAKVNGWHLPAIPLLAPRNIRPGLTVRVVYAQPKASAPQEIESVAVDAVVGQKVERSSRWTFAAAEGGPPRVLPGAVVVDKASGLAIGIVPGKAIRGQPVPATPEFLDLARLYEVTNAVALLPNPSVVTYEAGQPQAGAEREGMVWIPGGPAVIGSRMRMVRGSPENRLYGNAAACMRGFWIDKRPVTNEEYRRFLKATGHRMLPRFWSAPERDALRRSGDMPVMGVTTADAMDYAAWAGKRLVTPAEWERAAIGAPGVDWYRTYEDARSLANRAISRQLGSQLPGPNTGEEVLATLLAEHKLPPPMPVKGLSVSGGGSNGSRVRTAVEGVLRPVLEHFGFPKVIAPVSSRDGDRSIFGVQDVTLNGDGLLLPNLSVSDTLIPVFIGGVTVRPDIFPAWYDIYLSALMVNGHYAPLVGSDRRWVKQDLAKGLVRLTDSPPARWGIDWDAPGYDWTGALAPFALPGFRCAR